jgi:hypothetical protein
VVHLERTYGFQADNVMIEGPQAGDGWLIDGANTTHISHFDCRPPVAFITGTFGAGACLHGTGNFADAHIAHGSSASWHYGMEITYGSGWYAEDLDAVVSGNGVIFDPSFAAGQSVYSVGLTEVQADSSFGDNFLFSGDGWISDVDGKHLWASNSQAGNGLTANNPRLDGLQIAETTALVNHGHGMAILQGTNISAVATHSMMNSQAGSNLFDDIYIGNGAPVVSLTGGLTGVGGTGHALGSPFVANARYGINAQGGGPGQTITLMGMHGAGHITGFKNLGGVTSPSVLVDLGNSGS